MQAVALSRPYQQAKLPEVAELGRLEQRPAQSFWALAAWVYQAVLLARQPSGAAVAVVAQLPHRRLPPVEMAAEVLVACKVARWRSPGP
jgi:hypothetical protein